MAIRLLAGMTLATLALGPSIAAAQHPTHCEGETEPLLSVGDFDGDGTVTHSDVSLISDQVESGEYVAFYDLNADGVLDGRDVSAAATAMGDASTTLDQQLAELFWSTEMYRDRNVAVAAGYRPFTQILHGHGGHYSKLPFVPSASGGLDPNYENILDGNLEIGAPEGLNYDENGELVAVFYYHGINVKDWVFANQSGNAAWIQQLFGQSVQMGMHSAMSGGMHPMLYASHEAMWHQHWGGCWDGLDYIAMFFNPLIVPIFNQPLFPAECAARVTEGSRQGYLPAFNMLHVWLYKLNPCGTFAGTHPHLSMGYPEEPLTRSLDMWFTMMGLPNPYGDGGGHDH